MIRSLALVGAAAVLSGQGPGEALPAWTPGTLDIHQIHTARGNAALFVFPDGASLLLDAGDVPDRDGLELGPRPPGGLSTAAWIAAYVRRLVPKLDYALVTHYHDDHIAALPELASLIQIGTLIDRGDAPAPPQYPVVRRYLDFRRDFKGARRTARAGQSDLISPSPQFELRVVAANAQVWTGEKAVSAFPTTETPGENSLSIAIRLTYGRFRYFTGGDLPGVVLDDLPAWHDVETPVANATGPVDVAVLNHHGWLDSTNPHFLKTLSPRVVIIPAWHATHPDHGVLRRLRSPSWKPQRPDLFITSLLDAPAAIFRYLGEAFRSTAGHVVVRVAPGGASYRVITLDATSPAAPVKQAFGPYPSR